MKARNESARLSLTAMLVLTGWGTAHAALVDLTFTPAVQNATVGNFVDVQLFASSDDGTSRSISAMDVILSYDPAYLSLQSVTNPGGQWLASGFLPDLDGVNASITDGDAIYTALAPGAALPAVPPDLEVTTIRFLALAPTAGTDLIILPTIGAMGETRVFGEGVQNNVTGDFSSIATIRVVPEPASLALVALGGLLCARRRSGF